MTSVAEAYALVQGLPAGAWVAVSMDNGIVLSCGENAETVLDEARGKGEAEPLILKVPEHPSVMFL